MQEQHAFEVSVLQSEIQQKDFQIKKLQDQVSSLKMLIKQDEAEDAKSVAASSQHSSKSSYRTLQVADMTTFMAKLIYKLTEMSCAHAN